MAKPGFSLGVFFDLISIKRSDWEQELEFIKSLEKHGKPSHVEVLLEYPYSNKKLKEKDVKWIKKALEGYDLVLHAPCSNVSLMTPKENIRKASIEEHKASIDVAKAIGARLVTFHAGSSFFVDRDGVDHNQILKKGINPLIEHAKSKGIKLAIENLRSPHSFPVSMEQTKVVLDMFPDLKLTMDIGHYYFQNADPAKAIEHLLPRIRNIHLHDVNKDKESGELKDHQELGTGFIDVKSIIHALIKNNYSKYLTIETVDKEKIRRSYAMVREIIESY